MSDLVKTESPILKEIETLMSVESEKTPDILVSESSILIEEVNNNIINLTNALEDLNGDYTEEKLDKYEELTGESGIAGMMFENWMEIASNVIDRIIAYIKKMYDFIIINLKKIYVKFLVLFNKQKEIAQDLLNKIKNKDIDIIVFNANAKKLLFMYINNNKFLDGEIYNHLFNSDTLKFIIDNIKEINKIILLNVPKKEVYKDYISDDKGPLNDMINHYKEILVKKYNEIFFINNKVNKTINENMVHTTLKNDSNFPFGIISNGIDTEYLDIDEKGKLSINSVTLQTNKEKDLVSSDVLLKVLEDLTKYNIKTIIENDFKTLDIIKKDSDGYLNQTKRYNNVDTYALNMYGNNLTVLLNTVLKYSINRMELAKNILKIFN